MGVFEKALIEGNAIRELIPQRDPIVMVDSFYGINDNISVSGLLVKEENIFCSNGFLQEAGIIEHIAQSAAVRIGYLCKCDETAIPLGFIGSVNKLTLHQFPAVGDRLKTAINIVQEVGDITLIAASVRVGDRLIAEGQMKIFLSK